MILALILAIVGLAILLAVFFSKRVEPILHSFRRILAAILGIVLIGISLWISFFRPSEILQPLSTPTQSAAAVSPKPKGHPPVILNIQTHTTTTFLGAIASADIHFQDEDGDAYEVAYALVQSTVKVTNLQPDGIDASPEDQKKGATVTVEWNCQGTGAMILLKAVILDKAGNTSNLFPLLLNCG